MQHTGSAGNANSNSQIIWTIDIPNINDIAINRDGLEYTGWNQTVLNNGFRIPVKSKMIFTRYGPPIIDFDLGLTQILPVPESQPSHVEQAKGMELQADPSYPSSSGIVNLKHIKDAEGYQLWGVNVMGAEFSGSEGQLIIPERITVDIRTDISSPSHFQNEELYLNQYSHTPNRTLSENNSGLGQGNLKLHVLKDGIYRIYYDSLSQMDDFPSDQIGSRSLILRERDEEQAIHVNDHGDNIFNSGDYFDFIGKQKYFDGESQYYDAFSDINVYWLDWGGSDGLRFVEESGALVDLTPVRPTTFWDKIHIEEDNDFERLGQVDTDMPSITRDHYFWESVNSGVTKEVNYFLPNPFRGSSENLHISLGLHGLTYTDTGKVKSHTLFAFMNGNSIGDGSWVQQEEYVLTSPSALNLSHNILSANGENTLAIFAPVSTEPGNYDKIVLNWIEIGYEHLLKAQDDHLRFRKSFINPSTNLEYEIQGFQSHELVLYKEGLSKITGFTIRENWDASEPEYSLVFQDHSTEATPDYWVSSLDGVLQPLKTIIDTTALLREQDADMIVITIPQFVEDLEPYLEFKRSEGWNPIAVSVADIYDEFNWGIHSPLAIKSFLRYANNHWSSHPEYAVLFGDAISNPQQTKRDTRIQNIPTFYMQTYGWGAAEADYWYSLINGDDYLPDIHIGRIPCDDIEDLNTSITKLINYGSGENFGTWQNELITIAGFDTTFKIQTQSILKNTVPPAYMPSRIFIDRDSEGQIFWGDTDSLIEHWNRGKLLINFLGHGGGAVWADRSLFVRDDINYLDEDIPPAFVTSMTCFTASFAQTRGLGEVVVSESSTGAIGWFGSSGVGWLINDYLMVQPLIRRLLEDDKTVGEIINIARMEYFLANSGYDYLKPSMLFQYNYLGDPTTRLLRPEKHESLVSEKPIYEATEQLSLNYVGNIDGDINLLPINADNQPWWSLPQTYPGQPNSSFIISQEASAPAGIGRTIFTLDRGENESSIQGYASYSISSDWFEHQPPTAEELSQSPILPIRVKFHSSTLQADSMLLVLSGSNQTRIELIRNGEWWELADTTRLSAGTAATYYSFSAFAGGTHIQTSTTYTLYLPRDITLSVSELRVGVKGDLTGVYLDYSLGGQNMTTAALHVEAILSNGDQITDKTIEIYEGNNSVFLPLIFGIDTVEVIASLNILNDLELGDNALTRVLISEYYQIQPGLGITFDGQSADTLQLWSSGSISGGQGDTSWVRVRPYIEPISALPGVTLYQDSIIYLLEPSSQEITLRVESTRQLFQKDLNLSGWEYIEQVQSDVYLINGAGLITMGQKQDYTGPNVSMMIEGQLFFDGDYLLESSHLNLLGEDENGFSWDAASVHVIVDGTPVEPQLGDTTQSGQIMSATVALDLDVGEHNLSYQMSDALGNWSEEVAITGVVAGSAAIYDYGNFPNPFEGETLIIYELTQPLDDVAIDIFTLSGYKLHTINLFNARVSIGLGAIGYHEVPWNGRDRSDDFVANGVYFYRIKGQLDDEEILGPVGKMVKNR
ncbi:MAG: hypothetical protein H8E26_09945 [FCB group bacterium]|nr:hypothetical protein [FCB group bacterium]MBL7028152.1 hypothetical protein [Candidatus Neomarinimicrobiota bacterium]MBL7122908.1 hypothetical protein [Candidatus Neomarinimicrobiota bacterium]